VRAFARHMTERMKAVAAAGAVAAFWLAAWVFAAALVAQPLILPGPGAVALALLRLVCDGGTWAILVGSGARILGGLALAAVCGGVLAGISSRLRAFARLVAPALSFVKATPVACVVVLLLIWLGSARVSIAAVFLMALPGVYFSLAEGLAQVNKPLEQMFRLHGVRGWRLFCAHTWREVLPFVLSCARAVIGMSWKAGVAAELIGMAVGTVGERIYQAKLLVETADLLAWTVLVVAASCGCCGFRDPWRGARPCGRMGMDCAGVRGLRAMAPQRSLRLPWAIVRPGRRRWMVWCSTCLRVGVSA